MPRAAAPVQTAGSPSCSDAMPPQAARRSPSSRCFERGWRRRMIGGDEVDRVARRAPPQAIAICPPADRRRALERRRAVGDLLGGERQVVRAGFDGDGDARAPRSGDRVERVGRREVHDVHARAGLACEAHQQLDRRLLACRRTAVEPGRIATRIRRPCWRRAGSAGNSACASSGRPSLASDRQRLAQIGFGDVLELVDAGRTQKALEAEHAGARERLEVGGVAGHDAAPEARRRRDIAPRRRRASLRTPRRSSWRECC